MVLGWFTFQNCLWFHWLSCMRWTVCSNGQIYWATLASIVPLLQLACTTLFYLKIRLWQEYWRGLCSCTAEDVFYVLFSFVYLQRLFQYLLQNFSVTLAGYLDTFPWLFLECTLHYSWCGLQSKSLMNTLLKIRTVWGQDLCWSWHWITIFSELFHGSY